MSEKHFEIILSGRQMAMFIASLVGLVLVAFGLGIVVGVMEPPTVPERGAAQGELDSAAEAEFVTADAVHAEVDVPQEVPPLATPMEVGPHPDPSPSPEVVPSPTPAPSPTPNPPSTIPASPPARPTPTAGEVAAFEVWVQVGALSQPQQGEGLRQRVVALGFSPSQVVVSRGPDGRYRVRLGPFPDEESAGRVLARVRPQGFPDAFLVRE